MKWINSETGHVVEDFVHTECDKFRCSVCPVTLAALADDFTGSCSKWAENGHMEEAMRLLGYRPVDEAPKPAPEKKPFTKEDIKPGMVCILRGGDVCIVIPVDGSFPGLVLCTLQKDHLQGVISVENLTDELKCRPDDPDADVMKVLDISGRGGWVFEPDGIEKDRRKLLWERKEPKKVTKADIETMFGCEVEIVSEVAE